MKEENIKGPSSTDRHFNRLFFLMEILIAYCSDLIGLISALTGFSHMENVPWHALPVG